MSKHKINPVEEYFKDRVNSDLKKNELFDADNEDIDIKTDLTESRIVLVNTLHETDLFLVQRGLKPVFQSYYEKHLRLLISLDRKSRGEFVEVNKNKEEKIGEQFQQLLNPQRRG